LCAARILSKVNAATVRVLAAEGYEVVAPQEQLAVGHFLVHGRGRAAVELAKKND